MPAGSTLSSADSLGTLAMTATALQFETPDGPRQVDVDTCVIAGWTGRDQAALDHHIEELAELGVPAPSTVPLFYRVAVEQVIQTDRIQVLGADSSGEVEPVLIATPEGLLLTVGSDHTDRRVESYSIAVSKQMCPKVLAPAAWLVEPGDWMDRLVLESRALIGGRELPYQSGTLAMIRPLKDLVDGFGGLEPGTVFFCGTVPVDGGIRHADRFTMRLSDPESGAAVEHAYSIETLPLVS